MSDTDDRRKLQDVMLSYAAAVDDRDMVRYRACFADNVEIVGFGDATVTGADTWTASVESQLEAFSATQHLMSPQLHHIGRYGFCPHRCAGASHTKRRRQRHVYTVGNLPKRFCANWRRLEDHSP